MQWVGIWAEESGEDGVSGGFRWLGEKEGDGEDDVVVAVALYVSS